jgi:hypothetical protein
MPGQNMSPPPALARGGMGTWTPPISQPTTSFGPAPTGVPGANPQQPPQAGQWHRWNGPMRGGGGMPNGIMPLPQGGMPNGIMPLPQGGTPNGIMPPPQGGTPSGIMPPPQGGTPSGIMPLAPQTGQGPGQTPNFNQLLTPQTSPGLPGGPMPSPMRQPNQFA